MRFALVINSLEAGGAERILSSMANFWADKGHEVTLFTFDENRNPFYALHERVLHKPLGIGIAKTKRWRKILKLPRLLRVLRSSLKAARPDIVISFLDQTNLASIIATKGMKLPLIVSERVYPEFSPLLTRWTSPLVRSFVRRVWFFLLSQAKFVVFQTHACLDVLPPGLRKKSVVIPNSIDTPESAHHSFSLDRPCIVGMGRLVEQKRFDVLINAFAKISEKNPSWKLYIFGEGPQRSKLEVLRESVNLGGKIFLPGIAHSSSDVFSHSDLFVLSSDFEGFPNVLLESMAHGLPVIATNCMAGPSDIIAHTKNGILVPPGDIDSLAAAMSALMSDEARRAALGAEAKKVRTDFSVDRIMGLWTELALRARDKGSSPPPLSSLSQR